MEEEALMARRNYGIVIFPLDISALRQITKSMLHNPMNSQFSSCHGMHLICKQKLFASYSDLHD